MMGPGRPANECENDELVTEFEQACRGGDYEFAGEYREELLKRLNRDTPPVTTLKKGDRVEHPTRGKGTILKPGKLLSIIALDSGETYEVANIGLERLGISTEVTHE